MTGVELVKILNDNQLGNEDLLTTEQVSLYFGVTVHTVRQWKYRGHITPIELFGRNLYLRSDIENMLKRRITV